MSATPRILALAGSTRKGSSNKRLVRIAARGAEAAGAEVTVGDLRDFPLPLFDEDLERDEGTPENARRLKALMVGHDGLLISSPEYNSSISGVLKNAIDWASRPAHDEPPLVAFRGKVATILSASPGALGGLRGLVHLRSVLGNIGVIVLPDQVSIPSAFEAFAEDGTFRDPEKQPAVEGLRKALAGFVAKLKASPRSRRMTGSRSVADVARSSLNTKRRNDGQGAESRANHRLSVARPDHPGQ